MSELRHELRWEIVKRVVLDADYFPDEFMLVCFPPGDSPNAAAFLSIALAAEAISKRVRRGEQPRPTLALAVANDVVASEAATSPDEYFSVKVAPSPFLKLLGAHDSDKAGVVAQAIQDVYEPGDYFAMGGSRSAGVAFVSEDPEVIRNLAEEARPILEGREPPELPQLDA